VSVGRGLHFLSFCRQGRALLSSLTLPLLVVLEWSQHLASAHWAAGCPIVGLMTKESDLVF